MINLKHQILFLNQIQIFIMKLNHQIQIIQIIKLIKLIQIIQIIQIIQQIQQIQQIQIIHLIHLIQLIITGQIIHKVKITGLLKIQFKKVC